MPTKVVLIVLFDGDDRDVKFIVYDAGWHSFFTFVGVEGWGTEFGLVTVRE
jgi:hypothetical protein